MQVSSLNKAASAAIRTGPGAVASVVLTAGADTATVILYDNTAGSGTVILKLSAVANTSAVASFEHPLAVAVGIYATLSGTAPSATVGYL